MPQTRPQWMDEPLRPQYHYTAEKNMINDPNGLVYLDGEWHLFHQYNQHEVVHWGHAVSRDLLHWEHHDPAVFPDALGQIYSGTAVVDHHNISGLGSGNTPVIVAFFTYADHHDGTQSQGLAYSNDRGRSWTKHTGNPIIPNPGQKDFRDPKVLWHPDSDSWILIVTGGDHLEFFRSADLITWTHAFNWGTGHGSHEGVWECPDLFELPIDGTAETRWVVSVSVDRGAPAGGSGMQYFTGTFDGHTFTNDNPPETVLWQNWGQDYYAGITWENVPADDGRRIMIAWADNWLYRFDVPTTPFNGQLTVPRELRLHSTDGGVRLAAQPVRELTQLRKEPHSWGPRTIGDVAQTVLDLGDAYEVSVTFDIAGSTAAEFGVDVRVGTDQATRIGYRSDRSALFIDRSQSGLIPTAAFTTRHEAPLHLRHQELRLRILVDRSSVDVFTDDGTQLTDLILPDAASTGFRPYAVGGTAALTSLEIHHLARVWPDLPRQFTPLTGAWAQTRQDIRGSSHDALALAHLTGALPLSVSVTILGTQENNPTRILGQRAAGVALTDDGTAGIAVLVDLDRQQLVARDLATGTVLAAVDTQLDVNQNYRFVLASVDNGIETRINDTTTLRVNAAGLPARIALLVEDAEATFSVGEQS